MNMLLEATYVDILFQAIEQSTSRKAEDNHFLRDW